MRCLVVIPTINELENLRTLIPEILKSEPEVSVLVVNDAGTDGTVDFLEKVKETNPQLHFLERKERLGIGSAHVSGLRYAIANEFDYCLTMDADYTHDPMYIPVLLKELVDNPKLDVVIGSRFLDGGGIQNWSVFRRALTGGGHVLTLIFLGTKLDASSGFRIYRVSKIAPVMLAWLQNSHYEFFFKSAHFLEKEGYTIDQIPVVLDARAHGHSNMQLGHAIKSVWSILIMRVNYPFAIHRAKKHLNLN